MSAMSDRDDIIDLTIAYTWALDSKHVELLRDIFLPDATADLRGRQCTGVEEIIQRIGGSLTRFDVTQHLIGNHQVVVDGDSATCRCQLQSQHTRIGFPGGENYKIAGMYLDRLVRTPSGWRIAHRTMQQTWTEGNPQLLTG
jgi:hypothetical protein